MSEKLKPCPFCGASGKENLNCLFFVNDPQENRRAQIYCLECGAEGSIVTVEDNYSGSEVPEEALEAWNTRAPLCSPVKPEDIGYGRYFIRKDSVGVNLLRFVTVDLSGRLVVYKRSNEVGTVDDYVLRGHTFFRIPELHELEVAE